MKLTESEYILGSVPFIQVKGKEIYDYCGADGKYDYVFHIYRKYMIRAFASCTKRYCDNIDLVAVIHFNEEMSEDLRQCLHNSVLFGSPLMGRYSMDNRYDVDDLRKDCDNLLLCDYSGQPIHPNATFEERRIFNRKIIGYINKWIQDTDSIIDENVAMVCAGGAKVEKKVM